MGIFHQLGIAYPYSDCKNEQAQLSKVKLRTELSLARSGVNQNKTGSAWMGLSQRGLAPKFKFNSNMFCSDKHRFINSEDE